METTTGQDNREPDVEAHAMMSDERLKEDQHSLRCRTRTGQAVLQVVGLSVGSGGRWIAVGSCSANHAGWRRARGSCDWTTVPRCT